MHWVDLLAISLVIAAAIAFVMGESALSRAEDLLALYWLVVGITSLRAATHVARPGARA